MFREKIHSEGSTTPKADRTLILNFFEVYTDWIAAVLWNLTSVSISIRCISKFQNFKMSYFGCAVRKKFSFNNDFLLFHRSSYSILVWSVILFGTFLDAHLKKSVFVTTISEKKIAKTSLVILLNHFYFIFTHKIH